MKNVTAVIKLHFVNTRSVFVVPWLVMAGILVVNLAIWALVLTGVSDKHAVQDNLNYSGSSAYIFVYMLVFAAQTIARTWPFAQGFGATRRNFALGTALSFVLLSIAYAVILTLFAGLETLTNGWFIGGRMFNAVYYGDGSWYGHFFIYISYALFAFFVGAMFSAIYSRWRGLGITATFVVIAVVAAAAIKLAGISNFDTFVWQWTQASGSLGLIVFSVVPAVIAAIVGYLVLRRLTVRN